MGDSDKHCHAGELREELEKTLRPVEVLALALGAIVGWGCFVLPGIRFLPDAGPMGTVIAFPAGLSYTGEGDGTVLRYTAVFTEQIAATDREGTRYAD